MTSLYEVLKAQKMGAAIAPDYFTALWAGATGGGEQWEVLEYTGAVPVTITAAGEPLIELIISGNMNQSGTPSPQTVIFPEECGERTGNLFDGDYQLAILSISGSSATYYTGSSGRVAVIPCSPSTQYTAKKYGEANRFIIAESETKPSSGDTLAVIYNNSALVEYTFTTGANTHYVAIYVSTSSEQAEPPLMLNTGSTALPFSPYGYKIPISSANTTTPVYLGEVETTRQVKKLVLTGEETNIFKSGSYAGSFYISGKVPDIKGLSYEAYCSHASYTDLSHYVQNTFCFNGSPVNINLWFSQFDSNSTTEEFRQYLAQQYANGTPVTVWYVLANEQTGILNEPLRKIGNYADTLSVPQTIPTVEGENLIDIETTLKPSEIYLKYKGRSSE